MDPTNTETNAFVLFTPVQPDYSGLGSFGTIESVARTVIPDGPGIESNLLDSKTVKGNYFYDYTIKASEEQPVRHLLTIFAVVPSQTLVTFSAQTTEANYADKKALLQKTVDSFVIKP